MDNPNPEVKAIERRVLTRLDEDASLERRVFECLRDIRDPEHPNTLEELSVLEESSIVVVPPVGDEKGLVRVEFAPTVPHCSMASLIGLSIRAKLLDTKIVPKGYKIDVDVMKGTHSTDEDITKQLNDKERVAAALENPTLRNLVDDCLKGVSHLHPPPVTS